MKRYSSLAYGADITSDVDLSSHLSGGGFSLIELKLAASKNGLAQKLSESAPLFSSHGRELFLSSDRGLDSWIEGQRWAFEVGDLMTFRWCSGSTEIEYELFNEEAKGLLPFWFIHLFLPLYLSVDHGFDFLHAGAVAVGGHAVMFVAPSTGGKSTLTEFFVRQGHALLSDDKVATYIEEGRFMAVPSHANYRPYRAPEDLGFQASEFRDEPLEIKAIYALRRVGAEDPIEFHEITGFRKFDRVMPNYIFGLPFMKERRLRYLAGMVNSVPLFELRVPHDLQRLPEVYLAICGHEIAKQVMSQAREVPK